MANNTAAVLTTIRTTFFSPISSAMTHMPQNIAPYINMTDANLSKDIIGSIEYKHETSEKTRKAPM